MKVVKVIFSIVVVMLLIWATSTLFKKDSYIGFYYPDAGNLFNDIQSDGTFETLDACRSWIGEQKATRNPSGEKQDDYECGKNCKLQGGQKPYICDETLE